MSKLMTLSCSLAFLFLFIKSPDDRFIKYRSVEAYEVRPTILMMPSYTTDGQICRIELEKRHFKNETALLDSTMSHEVITQIFDELVPSGEKGPLIPNLGTDYLSLYGGNSVTTFAEYKNVSISIFGIASPIASAGDVVAVISWKNRKCQPAEAIPGRAAQP